MASSEGFLEFVCEQLRWVGDVRLARWFEHKMVIVTINQ